MVSAEALNIVNWIFTVGGVLFTIAMIPSLLRKTTAIPATSSGLTAGVLWVYVGCYELLGTTEAVFAGASTALIWTLLLVFRRPKNQVE